MTFPTGIITSLALNPIRSFPRPEKKSYFRMNLGSKFRLRFKMLRKLPNKAVLTFLITTKEPPEAIWPGDWWEKYIEISMEPINPTKLTNKWSWPSSGTWEFKPPVRWSQVSGSLHRWCCALLDSIFVHGVIVPGGLNGRKNQKEIEMVILTLVKLTLQTWRLTSLARFVFVCLLNWNSCSILIKRDELFVFCRQSK